MLRILLTCLIAVAIGCGGERGKRPDGSNTWGTFNRCEFDGHTYITYCEGMSESRVLGIEHDPDCKRCKDER